MVFHLFIFRPRKNKLKRYNMNEADPVLAAQIRVSVYYFYCNDQTFLLNPYPAEVKYLTSIKPDFTLLNGS